MAIRDEILKLSEKYRDYTAECLSKMVKIPSLSGKEEDVCKAILKMCQDAGFDEVRIDGLGSVIGRVGNGRRKLAFDAHIDTVEIGDRNQWKFDPFSGEIKDGLVYGRGTTDQSGGAASMIAAGRMLKELKYDGGFSCYFTFTVLEEDCDGIAWIYLVEKEGLKADYVISTEPTTCQVYRGHRGRMEIEVLLKGISSHGSIPEQGDSAAYKAAKAALAIERLNHELQPDEDNFLGKGSVTVAQMDASGSSQCSVPDRAKLYLDRRLTWGEDAELAIDQVKKYVTEAMGEEPEKVYMPYFNKRGYKNTDFGQELYFPTWKIDEDHELVAAARKAYKDLYGKDAVVTSGLGSTNAVSICGRYHIPTIIMGPGSLNACHKANETTKVEELVVSSAFYAMLPYVL